MMLMQTETIVKKINKPIFNNIVNFVFWPHCLPKMLTNADATTPISVSNTMLTWTHLLATLFSNMMVTEANINHIVHQYNKELPSMMLM